jgi:flagellar hook-associated protein 3 FlgL
MRITDNMRFNTTVNNMFKTQSQYNLLMEQISTQKRVNRASDDPIASTKIIDIRQELAANKQYMNNIENCDAWLSMTESKLSGAYDLLVKAKEIAVGQSTATANATSRKNAAKDVQSLIDEMAGLANAQLGDRYLFSGSQNATAPFLTTEVAAKIDAAVKAGNNVFAGTAVSSGTYSGTTNKTYAIRITSAGSLASATAQISTDGGRTWSNTAGDGTDLSVAGAMSGASIDLGNGAVITFDDGTGAKPFGENDIFVVDATAAGYYKGNDDELYVTISRGMSIAYNITGADVFTASGSNGVDIFKTLNDLKNALENDDSEGVSDGLGNLQKAQDQVTLHQSLCGTKANHIEIAKTSLETLNEKLTSLSSMAQDADLADLATRLSMKEVALQASYVLATKISDISILKFL